jgi:hypothetical protein
MTNQPTASDSAPESVALVGVVHDQVMGEEIYVFAERRDADRFAAAENHGYEEDSMPAMTWEPIINRGSVAGHQIATVRGDALERLGLETLPEKVRDGLDLAAFVQSVEFTECDDEVRRAIAGWVQEDKLV